MRVYSLEFDPVWVISPGQIIEAYLEHLDMTRKEFSQKTGFSMKFVNNIIDKGEKIEPLVAFNFERVLGGIAAESLLEFEYRYQFHLARLEEIEEAKQHKEWLKLFPIENLIARGTLKKPKSLAEKFTKILQFFWVSSVEIWEERYQSMKIRYRHAKSFDNDFYCLATWLRLGEIFAKEKYLEDKDNNYYEGTELRYKEFKSTKLKRKMNKFRALTRLPLSEAISELERICGWAGVILVIVAPVPKITVSGAAYWVNSKRPVIQLNTEYKTEDQFWFTFFHEVAHILLHNQENIFIDGKRTDDEQIEQQANEWTSDILIPKLDWEKFISSGKFKTSEVVDFANKIGIAPGIVVDRLQHSQLIEPRQLNQLKVKISKDIDWGLKLEPNRL